MVDAVELSMIEEIVFTRRTQLSSQSVLGYNNTYGLMLSFSYAARGHEGIILRRERVCRLKRYVSLAP